VIKSTERVPRFSEVKPLQERTRRVLVALYAILNLLALVGCAIAPQVSEQTMLHGTACGSMPLDTSKAIHALLMKENINLSQVSAEDEKNSRQTPFASSDSALKTMCSDPGCTIPAHEKIFSDEEKTIVRDVSPDWKGAWRDTAYFMGYQIVVAGFLYLLPESVTNWTEEQQRATVNKWAKNVQNPTWDKDKLWINYIGHPYWGGTYYMRARERGLDEFSAFWYSAFLSGLYEFGIEAFFEQPSYQDLVVTPLGGILIGKFIFEPIRASIKSKTELAWHDHLLLILTDPLGAANSFVDRSLGIKSNIRLAVPGPTPQWLGHSSHNGAAFLKMQDKNPSNRRGFGIMLDFAW